MIRKLVILLGLFTGLFGGQVSADQFQSEAQFKENLVRQVSMTSQTLALLYEYGVSEKSELKLEYFFYTNSEAKAKSLHEALVSKGYSGKYSQSVSDDSIYVVTGWTAPIRMDKDSAVKWTAAMCKLGFDHDAEFDGWGTNPEQ